MPRLILATATATATDGEVELGEQLTAIAPVAAFEFESSGQWKDYFRFYADTVNQAGEARVLRVEPASAQGLGEGIDGHQHGQRRGHRDGV